MFDLPCCHFVVFSVLVYSNRGFIRLSRRSMYLYVFHIYFLGTAPTQHNASEADRIMLKSILPLPLTLTLTRPLPQVFERQEVKEGGNSCSYRLVHEGLSFLLPYITKQRLQVSVPAFLRIIRERSVPIPAIPPTDSGADPEAAAAAEEPVPGADETGGLITMY